MVAACFDWNVAAPDGGVDATLDSPVADSPIADTGALDAPSDVVEGGPPDAVSAVCDPLKADLDSKRAAAQACTNAGQVCPDLGFPDECGCVVGVNDPDAGATSKYAVALSNYLDAGCPCTSTSVACSDAGWMCNPAGDAMACTQ